MINDSGQNTLNGRGIVFETSLIEDSNTPIRPKPKLIRPKPGFIRPKPKMIRPEAE